MKYGTTYSLADFFDRLVPASDPINRDLLKQTFDGVRRLARLQDENPFVTIYATLTAGIWIDYKGSKYCLINPAKNFFRVGAAYRNAEAADQMQSYFNKTLEREEIKEIEGVYLKQWQFSPEALPKLWQFFEQLEYPTPADKEEFVGKHPRFFPSEDRQTALENFEKEGRLCPGVGKKIPAHRVGQGEPIEFDHIIPHSKGGASTFWNLSILCKTCNQKKSDTAA